MALFYTEASDSCAPDDVKCRNKRLADLLKLDPRWKNQKLEYIVRMPIAKNNIDGLEPTTKTGWRGYFEEDE
jgi:hypothetical protein